MSSPGGPGHCRYSEKLDIGMSSYFKPASHDDIQNRCELAFLFLAYVVIKRSSQLIWRWLLVQLDSVDPERWGSWIPVRGETLGDLGDLWAALFWTLLGLMLVAPWLRSWWSKRRKSARPISSDDPLSSWLNIAGRWVCAVIYLDHLFLWLPLHPSWFMRQLHPDYF